VHAPPFFFFCLPEKTPARRTDDPRPRPGRGRHQRQRIALLGLIEGHDAPIHRAAPTQPKASDDTAFTVMFNVSPPSARARVATQPPAARAVARPAACARRVRGEKKKGAGFRTAAAGAPPKSVDGDATRRRRTAKSARFAWGGTASGRPRRPSSSTTPAARRKLLAVAALVGACLAAGAVRLTRRPLKK